MGVVHKPKQAGHSDIRVHALEVYVLRDLLEKQKVQSIFTDAA